MANTTTVRTSLTLITGLFLATCSVIGFGQASPAVHSLAAAKQAQPVDQSRSKSLEVRYRGGLMSVRSQNATLGEVLAAVSVKTGAEVEVPPALAAKHITAQLGPAPMKEVLERLLSSSQFDYILLGSEQGGKVSHIILREGDSVAASQVQREKIEDVPESSDVPASSPSENEAEHPGGVQQQLPRQREIINSTTTAPPTR